MAATAYLKGDTHGGKMEVEDRAKMQVGKNTIKKRTEIHSNSPYQTGSPAYLYQTTSRGTQMAPFMLGSLHRKFCLELRSPATTGSCEVQSLYLFGNPLCSSTGMPAYKHIAGVYLESQGHPQHDIQIPWAQVQRGPLPLTWG